MLFTEDFRDILTNHKIPKSNGGECNKAVIPGLPVRPSFNLPEDDGRKSDEDYQSSSK